MFKQLQPKDIAYLSKANDESTENTTKSQEEGNNSVLLKFHLNLTWWCKPIIPALREKRGEDYCKFGNLVLGTLSVCLSVYLCVSLSSFFSDLGCNLKLPHALYLSKSACFLSSLYLTCSCLSLGICVRTGHGLCCTDLKFPLPKKLIITFWFGLIKILRIVAECR